MIFVRDKGRMCNNILQYGHVYAWAREHGRKTVSMRFCYKYGYFRISSMPGHNFLTYVAAKYAAKAGLLPVVAFDEPDCSVAEGEKAMMSHRNMVVEGWYVRFYDLFIKYKDEIRRLFEFTPEVSRTTDARLRDAAQGCDFVIGLHVRRGDYKTFKGGRFYYDDATFIEKIRQTAALHEGRKVAVVVCGNDPTLDRRRYVEELEGMRVTFPDGNPGEDLCILSRCDCLVGPPSTFTLVAAMYRDTPLCWIYSREKRLDAADFKLFDNLFTNIE